MTRRTYSIIAAIVFLSFILVFPCLSLAYNKSWDQGHNCVNTLPGASGWGRYGYNTTSTTDYLGGNYPTEDCCEEYCKLCPVYANTGRLQKTFTDLRVPGVGPSLAITRTYLSQDWATALLGRGWVFNFGRKLTIMRTREGDKHVIVRQPAGELNFFEEHPDGTLELLAKYGVTYILIKNADGTYTIANKDGSVQSINANGNTTRIIDKNGNELSFAYDAVGCLSRITNASGNYVEFQLGPNGKIASISDNLGRTVTYSYDTNGNLTSSTDPMGNATQYAYDSENRLTQIIDARGNTIFSVTYDSFQPARVATFTEKGETWTITYYSNHTVKRDSSGNTWTYYFNDVGIIERVIDPLGNEEERYPNKVTSTSMDWKDDANGNRTSYTYDADGNIASKTDPLGNTWTYTYVVGTNRIETETDLLGVVTRYEYDGNGNRTRIIRDFGGSLENTTTYGYDSEGNQTSATDALGNTTAYEYDANGNLIKITDPLGNVTTYTYDNRGNRLTEKNALGNTTTYTYDLMNRLLSVTDALGNTTTYTYDGNGNLKSETNANGNTTTFVYDTYNRLNQISYPLSNTTSYTYDSRDNRLSMTDGNGNTTTYTYDIADRLIRETNTLGEQTNYANDAAGNLVSLTDAKGNTTTWTYDAANRIVQRRYPDGATYAYTYNAVGNKATETDANGNTTTFSYDRLNRLITKTYQDSSTSNYTYDALGRLLTGANADSTLVYSYDALGRATQSTLNGKTIAYAYDAVGNRVSMTTPEGETLQYTYNAASQMSRMQLSSGKGIDYTYDSLSRVTRKDYSSGSYSTYSSDAAGRLIQLRHLKSDDSAIYEQANTFDNVGNITAKTTGLGTTTYTYDAIYQLLVADHPTLPDETFTYDPAGNRLSSTDHSSWSYNSRNQLTGYNGATFAYDSNGNNTSKTDVSGTTTYTYDYENRLTRVDFPDGEYAMYKYDVLGRRIEKNTDGNVTGFIYDKNSLLAEYDSSGSLARNYIYGAEDSNPSMLFENSTVYNMHGDHLDTPMIVTSESGDIEWSASYKAFGQTSVNIENIVNSIRFPGQYYDSETNLNYNRYRTYDSEIGRYLQVDPVWFIHRWRTLRVNHDYSYAFSNPINYADPLGLAPCPLGEELTVVLAVGPIDAFTAWSLANQALSLAQNIGLPGLHNGHADAFRHCYWSCRMAQEIGVSQAKEVGDIHEDCNPNPAAERAMDLFNNAKGRGFGSSTGDCKDACYNEACHETLQISL